MVMLSSTGEVADFIDADQFQPGKSQFECGFFAVAICKAMAQVGKRPTQTVQQVIAEAEAWYAQYDGSDAISNTNGMSLGQLYDLLRQVGLHFQSTALNINVVKAWIALGYPVLLAIVEVSVRDLALGGRNPYPWRAAGTHIIIATGRTADGHILVRDSANVTNLYDPNSLRPGPRKYDANALQLVSATVVVPPWLSRPASATPPAVAPAATQAPASLTFSQDDLHIWQLVKPDIPYDTGIAQDWLRAHRLHNMYFGPPYERERAVTRDGKPYAEQQFGGALASWSHEAHKCTWLDTRGAIQVPA
jgi:hypothetical protein